ncbi:MAG: TGS domain-containing protein [Chloroflexota bacterium]
MSDATEFRRASSPSIFQDQCSKFMPKGDVKDLPAGATPLDFAYRNRHGHRPLAASGRRSTTAPCRSDYKLKNGDIVEIMITRATPAGCRATGWNPGHHEPCQGEDPAVVQAPAA